MGIADKNIALIVAAGKGLRAGGGLPKQYRPIAGVPMLRRTVLAFASHPAVSRIQVVISSEDRALYDAAVAGMELPEPAIGGETRAASVLSGLKAIEGHNPEHVLIHDAARPFVNAKTISAVVESLETSDAVLPAIEVVDALWRGGPQVETSQPRENLWRAQTPQGFGYDAILKAFEAADLDASDDVAIARAAGIDVKIVHGSEENFKVTTPEDFDRADNHLRSKCPDIRTGNGYDVHRFGDGSSVWLCGVEIPHARGLQGHSDADVGMHAITDALFGALAEGDIGQWFPPSDAQWKGAASEIFLRKAVERCAARGFAINHLDCTLICERPKIGPYAEAMRQEIARICGIEPGRVSVKATTSERLGFTGREEGIAAQATATLVRI